MPNRKFKENFVLIYSTFPSLKIAGEIIRVLVREKLIACGNIFKLSSIYTWKGKIEQTREYGAFIKTTSENYKRVENYIKKNHPYEVPEIISWPINKGLKKYLNWIQQVVR